MTGPGSGVAGPVPGEVLAGEGPVAILAGRPTIRLLVANTGDRPVQVGSHYHFAEANPALAFDRPAARGYRLAIPAGTSVRFEPGIERTVELVAYAGRRVAAGFRGEVAGPLDPVGAAAAAAAAAEGAAEPAADQAGSAAAEGVAGSSEGGM